MSQHIKFIRKATSLPVYRLKNDIHSYVEGLQNNENESTKLSTFAAITGLRAETLNIAGVSKIYRRVYVLCPDSGTYFHVGWILNCDAENCMVCGTGFRSSSKHHCRACGNVVCDKCSKHRAVVSPLDHLGPLRVCNLCCFGQSPVDSIANIRAGRSIIGDFPLDEAEQEEKEHEPISLWEFGRIEVMEIFPAFVVKTRRPNRTVVFVNICSCRGVPHNQNGLDKDDGILYMCCGEKGITANDHSVYDIAVSPTLVTLARKDRAILTKVCEQALIAITLLRREKDFLHYTIESTFEEAPNNYMKRKILTRSLSQEKLEGDEVYIETKILAVPSKLAFQTLMQVAASMSDVSTPAPISLNGLSADKRNVEVQHHAAHHKDRITAKLLCRTMSQLHVNGNHEEPKEPKVEHRPSADSKPPLDPHHYNHHKALKEGLALYGDVSSSFSADSSIEEKFDDHRPESASRSTTPLSAGSRHRRSLSDGSGMKSRSDNSWQSIVLSPNPGFVIKTWRAYDPDQKVFINVFHNEIIDALLDRDEYVLPDDQQPFCAFGAEVSHAEDKEGNHIPLYQVVIGSSYFMESYITSERKITDDDRIQKIIEGVNGKFSSNLDPTDFVILRVKGGFKGQWIDNMNFLYRLPSRQYIVKRRARKGSDDANQRFNAMMISNTPSRSMRASNDTESVMSEVTDDSRGSSKSSRRSIRASITDALLSTFTTEPNDLNITPDMFLFRPHDNIDWQDQVVLKHYSIEKPDALMGWQISRGAAQGSPSEIFIVTGVRKNTLSKTEYRLTALGKPDIWCGLKRGEKKSGYRFTPYRKVLTLQEPEKGK